MTGVSKNVNQIVYFLLILTLFGAILLPSISAGSSLPKLEISDLTFLLISVISVTFYRKEMMLFIRQNRWIYFLLFGLILVGLLGLMYHKTYSHLSNLFEPIKIIKLGAFIFFFYLFLDYSKVYKWLIALFVLVLSFNILHYFNIFNFNSVVEPWYAPPHHLDYFGLNSIGQPSTKRMLGTLGNPNNNAVLFLSFLVLFLPHKGREKWADLLFPILAILGIVMCQSRSGFLAFAALLLFYFIFVRPSWKVILILVGSTGGIFILNYIAGNVYMSTVGNMDVMGRASKSRMLQWKRIIASVKGNWIIGRGIDKVFMRSNEIHPESEYFLHLFRYGISGVVLLLLLYAQLFFSTVKKIGEKSGLLIPGIIIVFGIAGLTNTPLQSPKLSIIFALIIGLGLRSIYERRKI